MQVSIVRSGKNNDSLPPKPRARGLSFPDALADEIVYRVVGEATNEAEREASEDIISGKLSNTRRVQLKLFRWPNENDTGLLAVLQYDFLDANPAMSCPSIGLLVHLVKNPVNWKVRDEYLLETSHHFALQRAGLIDLAGQGPHQLVIESDSGGAGTAAVNLKVFDLSPGRFEDSSMRTRGCRMRIRTATSRSWISTGPYEAMANDSVSKRRLRSQTASFSGRLLSPTLVTSGDTASTPGRSQTATECWPAPLSCGASNSGLAIRHGESSAWLAHDRFSWRQLSGTRKSWKP